MSVFRGGLLQAERLMQREPRYVILLQLLKDEGLSAVVIDFVLGLQMDDKEHVLPQVVFLLYMMHEPLIRVTVELNETS